MMSRDVTYSHLCPFSPQILDDLLEIDRVTAHF